MGLQGCPNSDFPAIGGKKRDRYSYRLGAERYTRIYLVVVMFFFQIRIPSALLSEGTEHVNWAHVYLFRRKLGPEIAGNEIVWLSARPDNLKYIIGTR